MSRTILIIAFHFPPVASSSGVQRALKVVRYLREEGWQPVVLTARPLAYATKNASQLGEIPHDVPVYRAFGLDATRHLAIRGRFPGFLAWPDPWSSWCPFAIHLGRKLVRRYSPSVIWSTFPISSVNVVAGRLAEWSRLPWVADFRDPMTLDGYPKDPARFRLARRIEQKTVRLASRIIFTADHTRREYLERYPDLRDRSEVIPNGYDEGNFPQVPAPTVRPASKAVLLHSGALQPNGRNPAAFLEALRMLRESGRITPHTLQVVFRGTGFADRYRQSAAEAGVSDLVSFPEALPYEDAIREMVDADALMLFQGTAYNHAVPAKIYEYLYARRPVFGIVDRQGETYRVLRELGFGSIADIDDADEIATALDEFLTAVREGTCSLPGQETVDRYSRRNQTRQLSNILKTVVAQHPVPS